MADELKPCPYCGDAEPGVYEALHSDDKVYRYLVECATCGASVYGLPCTSDVRAVESAIEAWNRRTTDETCEADLIDVEELRVAVKVFECSKCRMSWETVWAHDFTYCPYCGAKMAAD